MGKQLFGASGPDQGATASVGFLVGAHGWADTALIRGFAWCQAIQRAAGGAPGVQVERLSSEAVAIRQAIERLSATAAGAHLDGGVLDAHLGGLRGHSLVLVVRDLPAAGGDQAQGLLLFHQTSGGGPNDLALREPHLDAMTTRDRGTGRPEDAEVIAGPSVSGDTGDAAHRRFSREVRAFAPVVDALRRSIYQRLYLATCGSGRGVDQLARKLAVLTLKAIHWNRDPLSFPATQPGAQVGPGSGGQVQVAEGTRYFADRGDRVKLSAASDAFLPGSQEIVR